MERIRFVCKTGETDKFYDDVKNFGYCGKNYVLYMGHDTIYLPRDKWEFYTYDDGIEVFGEYEE